MHANFMNILLREQPRVARSNYVDLRAFQIEQDAASTLPLNTCLYISLFFRYLFRFAGECSVCTEMY